MPVSLESVDVFKGNVVLIEGAGWSTDPVTVTINHGPLRSIVLEPATGDISSDGVIEWAPEEPGTYTLTADDGNDDISAEVRVFIH